MQVSEEQRGMNSPQQRGGRLAASYGSTKNMDL